MTNLNSPEYFYVKAGVPEQRGLYKLLIKKHKVAPEIVIACLDEMRATKLAYIDKEPLSNREKKYWTEKRRLKYVLELTCFEDNFSNFLKLISEKTGIVFKKYGRSRSTYDDWYAEASMDGTLAYNNVTDDF